MRLARPKHHRELVDITPLIDVVFNLLIFFMLSGAMTAAEILPVDPARSTSEMRGQVEDFVLLIDAEERIALGERLLPRDEVQDRVRAALQRNPGLLIQLKPDTATDAAFVIALMEDIRSAGAEYLVLLTVASQVGSGA